ncbi:MAG TPA: hypothetical protein VG937_10775 [Polyangiaceae bacterium]|nr:hypothetical protein [Polyangiaceae bacterium]
MSTASDEPVDAASDDPGRSDADLAAERLARLKQVALDLELEAGWHILDGADPSSAVQHPAEIVRAVLAARTNPSEESAKLLDDLAKVSRAYLERNWRSLPTDVRGDLVGPRHRAAHEMLSVADGLVGKYLVDVAKPDAARRHAHQMVDVLFGSVAGLPDWLAPLRPALEADFDSDKRREKAIDDIHRLLPLVDRAGAQGKRDMAERCVRAILRAMGCDEKVAKSIFDYERKQAERGLL